MKHIRIFEDFANPSDEKFEAYNEFGLEDAENVKLAQDALSNANIACDISSGGGITFFVFQNSEDLEAATSLVDKVIDKTKEEEWE